MSAPGRFEGDPALDGLDDVFARLDAQGAVFARGERDLGFAKGTRGTVELTAGETELVRRLSRVADAAHARARSNVGYATRADRTGHRIDARAFRKIAEAHRTAALDVETIRDDVRRGVFL